MKKDHNNKRKIAIASALVATAAVAGGTYALNRPASATEGESIDTTSKRERKELSDEQKAEMRAKLENMTEEEREEWRKQHKRESKGERREKPENMSDEEWEQKKAEHEAKLEEKLNSMTEEEKAEWQNNHKRPSRKNQATE